MHLLIGFFCLTSNRFLNSFINDTTSCGQKAQTLSLYYRKYPVVITNFTIQNAVYDKNVNNCFCIKSFELQNDEIQEQQTKDEKKHSVGVHCLTKVRYQGTIVLDWISQR